MAAVTQFMAAQGTSSHKQSKRELEDDAATGDRNRDHTNSGISHAGYREAKEYDQHIRHLKELSSAKTMQRVRLKRDKRMADVQRCSEERDAMRANAEHCPEPTATIGQRKNMRAKIGIRRAKVSVRAADSTSDADVHHRHKNSELRPLTTVTQPVASAKTDSMLSATELAQRGLYRSANPSV